MSGDDDERTVFGQKLPVPGESADRRPPAPQPGQPGYVPPPPPGYPLPPAPAPPQNYGAGRAAPVQPPSPYHEDTWLGGALNPFGQQQPPAAPPMPQPPAYGQQPIYQPQHMPQGANMFPEVPREAQPQARPITPRISLQDALRGTGLGAGGSSNILIAAASNLLILLGRLRTGLVDMQAAPLMEHVTREIDLYERNVLQAGVTQADASDAKYALAATADDIVQNLPGADRSTWLQYSMVARFFGERESGVGFFRKMDQAMQAPGQRFNLLEVMLTCLSLGFEGQYRTARNGPVELARIRTAIYETLRRVRPRPDDDISVAWTPMPLGQKRRYGGVPLWAIAGVGAGLVVALFATLSTLIHKQGAEVQTHILALHEGLPTISIERTSPVAEAYVAATNTQLDRIRERLAAQIEEGLVVVDQTNQYIFVRVGDALQFRSGSADLENDFAPLAAEIGRALEPEPGPIRVVGHTDSVPLSGRGRHKTNEDLSLARAETVSGILAGFLTDATRLQTEGLGPQSPVAENDTPEGRALNRRVEVMIQREGVADTLAAAPEAAAEEEAGE
jgi:type VI secretion system protein ImpK